MMSNYSIPVLPATAGNSGGFGNDNSFFWVFALLILGGGGLGGIGGGRGAVPEVSGYQLGELAGKVATKDSITMLQNSTNQGFAGLSAQSATETAQVQNSMNQGFSGINTVVQNGFQQTFIGLSDRIAQVASAVAQCCCDLKLLICQEIGQVRYDMANFAAQTNANIADWGNKILMDNSRRAEMAQAQRINQLELQSAICGIPKVANQFTYPAPNPYSYNGCGCQGQF